MSEIDSRDAFRLELPQGTTLVFQRRGDRFHHHFEHSRGETSLQIAESIEGDDSQTWPASPPLQDLATHRDEQGMVLLGVGRAGRSHWSIAVSMVSSQPGQPCDSFRFEVACRTREIPERLASSYRVLIPEQGTWQVLTAPDPVLTQHDARHWSCRLEPIPDRVGTFVWTYQWTARI